MRVPGSYVLVALTCLMFSSNGNPIQEGDDVVSRAVSLDHHPVHASVASQVSTPSISRKSPIAEVPMLGSKEETPSFSIVTVQTDNHRGNGPVLGGLVTPSATKHISSPLVLTGDDVENDTIFSNLDEEKWNGRNGSLTEGDSRADVVHDYESSSDLGIEDHTETVGSPQEMDSEKNAAMDQDNKAPSSDPVDGGQSNPVPPGSTSNTVNSGPGIGTEGLVSPPNIRHVVVQTSTSNSAGLNSHVVPQASTSNSAGLNSHVVPQASTSNSAGLNSHVVPQTSTSNSAGLKSHVVRQRATSNSAGLNSSAGRRKRSKPHFAKQK